MHVFFVPHMLFLWPSLLETPNAWRRGHGRGSSLRCRREARTTCHRNEGESGRFSKAPIYTNLSTQGSHCCKPAVPHSVLPVWRGGLYFSTGWAQRPTIKWNLLGRGLEDFAGQVQVGRGLEENVLSDGMPIRKKQFLYFCKGSGSNLIV